MKSLKTKKHGGTKTWIKRAIAVLRFMCMIHCPVTCYQLRRLINAIRNETSLSSILCLTLNPWTVGTTMKDQIDKEGGGIGKNEGGNPFLMACDNNSVCFSKNEWRTERHPLKGMDDRQHRICMHQGKNFSSFFLIEDSFEHGPWSSLKRRFLSIFMHHIILTEL